MTSNMQLLQQEIDAQTPERKRLDEVQNALIRREKVKPFAERFKELFKAEASDQALHKVLVEAEAAIFTNLKDCFPPTIHELQMAVIKGCWVYHRGFVLSLENLMGDFPTSTAQYEALYGTEA